MFFENQVEDYENQGFRVPFGLNQDDEYEVTIFGIYPPRILRFQIYLILSENKEYGTSILKPIKSSPFETSILPILQPFRTEIYGNDLAGVTIGEDVTVYVLLKDVEGNCYYTSEAEDIQVRIDGPYETPDDDVYFADPRTKIVDSKFQAEFKVTSGEEGKICSTYYEITFKQTTVEDANLFQTTGWY